MQGFRNYNFEAQQRGQQHSIVVDIIPSQYTKTTTPPLSPNYKGMQPLDIHIYLIGWDDEALFTSKPDRFLIIIIMCVWPLFVIN